MPKIKRLRGVPELSECLPMTTCSLLVPSPRKWNSPEASHQDSRAQRIPTLFFFHYSFLHIYQVFCLYAVFCNMVCNYSHIMSYDDCSLQQYSAMFYDNLFTFCYALYSPGFQWSPSFVVICITHLQLFLTFVQSTTWGLFKQWRAQTSHNEHIL